MATLLRKIGFSRLRPPVVTRSPKVSRKGTVSVDVLRANSSSSTGGAQRHQQQHQQQQHQQQQQQHHHQQQHLAGVLNDS
ncbi:unnamed protein product, partial [Lampetra planeri]